MAGGQTLPLRPTFVGCEGTSKGEQAMKKLLMATVATIALTAGGAWAAEPAAHGGGKGQAAEMKGQAAGKAETTGSGAAAKSDADVKAGTEAKPGKAKSELPKAKSEGSKAQSQMKGKSETTGSGNETKSGADMKSGTSSKSQTTGAGSDSKKSQTTGAGSDSQKAAEPKTDSTRTPTGAAGQTGQPSSSSSSNQGSSSSTTATTGSNTGAAVSLTNEQKTKIRTTVIQSGSAPKIERSQINFSLNVGTVVPRSVRVVTVPTTLVEIHPAWRGFKYFVVADEIIIVEPDTLKIVAVLTV